jgi:hypothetical protein
MVRYDTHILYRILAIVIPFLFSFNASGMQCRQLFEVSRQYLERDLFGPSEPVKIIRWGSGYMANGVPITSSQHYPIEIVLKNLGFENAMNTLLAMPKYGVRVLSVGEGMGGLVPFFVKSGFNVKGLDIWYGLKDLPENLKNYYLQYRQYLIQGSSKSIPARAGEFHLVVSHALLNNLPEASIMPSLREMIRVTTKGGQVRAAFCCMAYNDIIQKLKSEYGPSINISTKQFYSVYTPEAIYREIELESTLLIIEKN